MNIEIIGITLEAIGTILIAFTALKVHHHVIKEHKIDNKVFKIMRREQVVGMLGIVLVAVGYAFQMVFNFK